MTWSEPFAFIGLAAIPIAFYFIAKRAEKRNEIIESSFAPEMTSRLFPPRSKTLLFVKNFFLATALVSFVLTLAGPKFGRVEETTATFGRDVFVLLDVSDSMLAEDVAPNRLTVAKLDVEDLLGAAVGDRVGLIAFAGSAQVEIPLTTDRTFFRELLQTVDVNSVKFGGTAIGDAIRLALSRFDDASDRARAIVLITDGEDWDSLPLEAARNAADANVPVFAIAIGDPQGAKIPEFDVAGRRVGFKTFDGKIATSKPDVETLKQIASATGGQYFFADATLDLANVYKNGIDKLNRTRINEKSRVVLKDRYQPFLAFGLFAFAVYYYFPTRTSRVGKSTPFAVAFLVVFASNAAFATEKSRENDDATVNSVNNEIVKSQDVAADALLKNRRAEIDAFNRAVNATLAGRTDEARQIQTILRDAKSPQVAARANFNLGVDATKRAIETARKLDAENENATRSNTDLNSPPASSSNAAPESVDPVARYETERANRQSAQNATAQELRNAARFFGDARKERSTRSDALVATDAAVDWAATQNADWRAFEIRERDRLLADPNDRLRWLDGETKRRADRVASLNATSDGAAFYKTLFDESRALSELDAEGEIVARKLAAIVADELDDAEGARKIVAAKDEFLKRRRDAAARFARYDAVGGRDELENAAAELSAIRDVATSYSTLAIQQVAQEEKTTTDFSAPALRNAANENAATFVRSRETLRRAVDELLRKAKGEIGLQNASNENDDEPSAEKIRDSMKIAVELAPEISPLIDEIQRLANGENYRANADSIAAAQEKILTILQEIAKPLQDENQSQSDSQNQNQRQNENEQKQNDKQNSQNSDAQKDANSAENSSNGKEDDKAQPETPQELNEAKRPGDDDLKDDSQSNDATRENETPSDSNAENETKRDADASENASKTDAQKEADALARRVYRRQKDAQAERDAVRRALQKREKSGKDW